MLKLISHLIILGIIIIFGGFAYYNYQINRTGEANQEDKVFEVKPGEGVNQISYNLGEAGLIKSKFWFETYLWREEKEGNLQAGTYVLNPSLSIIEIVEILENGDILNNEREIKIIEGWRIDDIDKYLSEKNILEKGEFKKTAENLASFESEIADLGLDGKSSLEGFLFPDTYRIFSDASAQDIIKKSLDNFNKKLDLNLRAEIRKQGKTIYEIITMASIIEKEVRSIDDMRLVAGVFWNRIKNTQALESCASLAYILGENKAQYSYEDTRIESPYNTYLNRGLPPGPIANPGLNAIRAAINPQDSDYNFFLTSSIDGKTIFSKTLDEHNANKRKYLKS